MAAEPETKRLAAWNCFKKGSEIRKRRPCGIASETAGFEVTRPPPLARRADDITRFLKQIRVNRELLRQKSPQAASFFEAMWILACQHRGARWSARRCCAETIIEEHAFPRHAIERWRLDDLVAVNSGVRPGPIIGQTIKNVGTRIGGMN